MGDARGHSPAGQKELSLIVKLHLHLYRGAVDQGWLLEPLSGLDWIGWAWIGRQVRNSCSAGHKAQSIIIPTETRRAPHSAGGVTSGYPSVGMRRARAMLTSWWNCWKEHLGGRGRTTGRRRNGWGSFCSGLPTTLAWARAELRLKRARQATGRLISNNRDILQRLTQICPATPSLGRGPGPF